MKVVYWLLTFLGGFFLAYAVFGATPPVIENVSGAELEAWYREVAMFSGLIVGPLWGFLWATGAISGPWKLKHQPRESGDEFNSRVATRGNIALAVAGLCWAPVVVVIGSATADFVPLAFMERMLALLFAGKALGVVGSTILGTSVANAAAIRMRIWGGQGALIPLSSE